MLRGIENLEADDWRRECVLEGVQVICVQINQIVGANGPSSLKY